MRAERLLTIALDISRDINETQIIERLAELVDALSDVARSDSDESESLVASAYSDVIEAIQNSKVRSYPPALWEVIVNMRIDHFYGEDMINGLDRDLQAKGVTPAVARNAVKKRMETLQGLKASANAVIDALDYFEIESDGLSPGDFELMIQIPSRAIHDELGQFGKEAIRINSMLSVFTEIATGSREPIKLRAVGSSDPTLFLDSLPATAALVATSIERVAAFYAQIQGIMKTHREMKVQNVPAPVVDGMKKHIDDSVKSGLDGIAKAIERESMKNVPVDRKPELKTELKKSLYELARRIDEGYVFDVRGSAPADNEDDQEPAPDRVATEKAFRIVEEARPRIQHFEAEAEPILSLPRPDDEPTQPT